jgi:hypothetical protein
MEGFCCIDSSGSSGTTRGLHRRCIFLAADHVHDFFVDYTSLRPPRMVFAKLFEFCAVFFEHRRRYPRIIRSSIPPRFVSHNHDASVFVSSPTTSSTPATAGCVGIFDLAVLLRLRPPWRPSLLVPQTMASGCALSLARPVLATPVRAFVLDAFTGPGKPGARLAMAVFDYVLGIDLLPRRLPRRITVFVYGASAHQTLASPRAPAASCAASSSSATSTVYIDHGYYTHGTFDHGYSSSCSVYLDIGTKGYR